MTLRVLQVCCTPPPPGLTLPERLALWTTIADVAEAASAAGVQVTVLLDGPADDELHRAGVHYRQVAGLRRSSWRDPMVPRAASLARQLAPDVIHMMGLESPIVTRALCRTGIPVLAQDHASRPRRRGAALWRWGLARLAGAAFTAREQAEPFLRARLLSARTRIFAIPENSSCFTPGGAEEARALTGISGAPALLWVGHFDANKNPLMVLRAVQLLIPQLPQVTLSCAFGTSPLRPQVEAFLASDAELRARVCLLGAVPHARMEALYRASDAFVSASRREGSGYALIEALACGLPAIVTDIPSFRALTGDGAAGALVPQDDSEAMAAAILREFARGTRLDAVRRRAVRDHFERHLSFASVGAQLALAYAALVDARACV